jgi:hypothetical protein
MCANVRRETSANNFGYLRHSHPARLLPVSILHFAIGGPILKYVRYSPPPDNADARNAVQRYNSAIKSDWNYPAVGFVKK